MNTYVVPPPDNDAMPAAFRDALPVEPRADEHMAQAIERGLSHAAMPAAAGRKRMEEGADIAIDGVHRASVIAGALREAFRGAQGPDGLKSWMEQARHALAVWPREQGAGFVELPATQGFLRALRRLTANDKMSLTWTAVAGVVWGVYYCDEDQRREYLVKLGSVITRGPRDEVFDTQKLHAFLVGEAHVGIGAVKEGAGACIWVVDDLDAAEPRLYSHLCMMGRFHHTSFLQGRDIGAGGEWRVEGGKLVHISGASGHYRPEKWRLLRTLDLLKRGGVIVDDRPKVLLYRGAERFGIPCMDVLNQRATFEGQAWDVCPHRGV